MTSNVWQGWQDFAPMVGEELVTWSLQVAGLLGAVWVVTALLLRKQTGLRSALWLTALLLIPLLPLGARITPVPTASLAGTLDLLRKSTPAEDLPSAMPEPPVARVGPAPSSPEPTAAVPPTTVTSAVQSGPTPTELAALEGPPTFWSDSHFWAAAAVLAWGLGVLVMLTRLVLGARWVSRLLRRAEPVSDPSLLKAFEETQRQIAVARPVQLRTSALVPVPMTVGVFHPVIILPRSALDVSRRQLLEHALCHELAHVKRWDAATTLYRRVLEAVLFFHPLVWLANRRYQLEQEHVCDDWAVAALGSRRQYARSLAELAEQAAHAAPVAALSFAHRPSAIRRRVTRVLEGKEMPKPRLGLRGMAVAGIVSLALMVVATSLTLRSRAAEAAPSDEPKERTGVTLHDIDQPMEGQEHHGRASFEEVSVTLSSIWLRGPELITVESDGSTEYSLEKGPQGGVSPYHARFRLKPEHLRELQQLLMETGWLTKPGAGQGASHTDATKFTINLVRDGTIRRATCYNHAPEPYGPLLRFFSRLRRQEHLLYRLTAVSVARSEAARDITQELRALQGEPVAPHPYPILDYHRFVPTFTETVADPYDRPTEEIVAALRLFGFLRMESQRENIAALSRDRNSYVRGAVADALAQLGGTGSVPVLKEMLRTTRTDAAWALIRLGPVAVPTIVEIIGLPPNPNDMRYQDLIRAYIDHWKELPGPLDTRVVEAVRKNMEARRTYDGWIEYHERFLELARTAPPAPAADVENPEDPPAPEAQPAGPSRTETLLKHDDGTMEGKRSLAGSGHFVQFECPPGKWYLTEVHIFGSRYGAAQPPRDDWTITLCDSQFKTVRFIRKPYSLFQRGAERRYKIPVPPLELPSKLWSADRPSVSPDRRYVQMDLRSSGEERAGSYVAFLPVPFWINVAFDPSSTKGVYLGYDSSDQECFSKAGLPDQRPKDIEEKYDWMIRLVVTQDPPKEVSPDLGVWLEPREALPSWQEEGLSELKNDDGESDGKLSMGAQGPAVRFDNVPEGATLTRLRMYASRYGSGFDPKTTFADYYLFDTEGRILQTGRIPYALFAYEEKWVDIPLKPVKVPGTFWVLINPQAHRLKGIYTHYDTDIEATHSKAGRTPEELSDLKTKCDWMIRAYIRSDAHSSNPGSGAGAGGELTERRYDLSGLPGASPLQRRRDDERLPEPLANLLVDEAETGIVGLIKMVTGEKVWEVGHVSQEGSTLTVTNTAQVHGQVEEVLETLRAHPNLAVRVELRFIAADPVWRDKWPRLSDAIRLLPVGTSAKGVTAAIIRPDQERALLIFVEATRSTTLSNPLRTVYNGQLAYVAVVGVTKVLALQGRAAPAEPVWAGQVVELRPFVQKDLKSIWLWLNAANSRVHDVERTRADGTVEKVPEVSTTQLVTTLAGPDGSAFLISLGPMAQQAEQGGDGREPRELLVVVKTKVLTEDEAEVNPPELMKP